MKWFFVSLVAILFASEAAARNTEHFYAIADAIRDGQGSARLGSDIQFYFADGKHPAVKRSLGIWSTRKSTRGVFRSDEASCHVAFISGLLQLQRRARTEGGNAVVEINSITRGTKTSSRTKYRCVAGATVVHVGLEGRVVQLPAR